MKGKTLWPGIGASIGMLILILDGKTAISGMHDGIALCLSTVVPSLFPFFVLSVFVTSSFMGTDLAVLRPLGRFCGIPRGAESILIPGFLGGYPVGAQAVAQAYANGSLSQKDAQRLLGFCNNAGPAFLFGMVSPMFPDKWMAWALWGIHIAGAVFAARILPGFSDDSVGLTPCENISLYEAMGRALKTMSAVCGWVVLFRVVIAFLNRWILWILPDPARVAVLGILELSNGCCSLPELPDVSVRFLLCSGMLAFGGLSVIMQTVSVAKGLSLLVFALGKLLQTAVSLVLAASVVAGVWIPCGLFLFMIAAFPPKKKKGSSISPAGSV